MFAYVVLHFVFCRSGEVDLHRMTFAWTVDVVAVVVNGGVTFRYPTGARTEPMPVHDEDVSNFTKGLNSRSTSAALN